MPLARSEARATAAKHGRDLSAMRPILTSSYRFRSTQSREDAGLATSVLNVTRTSATLIYLAGLVVTALFWLGFWQIGKRSPFTDAAFIGICYMLLVGWGSALYWFYEIIRGTAANE